MRVALATWDWPTFTGGGVASLSESLALGLVELGVSVEVWTRGGGHRQATLERSPPGLVVRGLRGRSWRARGRAHWRSALPGLVSSFRPDAIVVSPWDPLPGILEGLDAADRPPIWVFAHGREITARLPSEREQDRAGIFGGDFGWLCLTDWMRDQLALRGVPPGRIVTVPAAVAPPLQGPERSAGEPGAGLSILTVSRLIPRKGHDVLLRAIAQLDDPSVRCRVVGEGPDQPRLAALVRELGLENTVSLEGRLDGAAFEAAWGGADLFAMLPREEEGGDTEGFGLVFLEAASRGLPVLAGASGGAAEAVHHEVDGLQVQDPCDVAAVAAALERLRDDPGLRLRLGTAGQRRFEESGRPRHLARAVVDAVSFVAPSSSRPRVRPSSARRWVVAVRAALPSPRPQGWQAFQQAVGLARAGVEEVVLVGDAGLPDGGPSSLQDWLGTPLPPNLEVRVPARWRRPPTAGLLFRKALRGLRSPDAVLLCRDPRVAAAEGGHWGKVFLEWHVQPKPELRGHAAALAAADLHLPVSEGIRRDLLELGVSEDRISVLPNACGLDPARARDRWNRQTEGTVAPKPVLALGLHRRAGLDVALEAWRREPSLPTLLVGGRDQGGERARLWQEQVEADDRLRGRVRLLGPVWGEDRERLLDEAGLWLCLYPRDEDSVDRLCPLQVADAAGSGLPLVASDFPSVRGLLGEGLGLLVSPEDPELVARAVLLGLDSRPPDPLQRPRWQHRASRLIQLA